jgi:hypothetical protein
MAQFGERLANGNPKPIRSATNRFKFCLTDTDPPIRLRIRFGPTLQLDAFAIIGPIEHLVIQ